MMKAIGNLEHKERVILSIIFVVIFGLLISDVVEDLASGASLMHVGIEAFILALVLFGILIQWTVYFGQKQSIKKLSLNLENVRRDLDNYKKESKKFIEGLSRSIDDQLSSWGLTKAEKEIALLILKGLSNKEIGEVRQTSESTVRQQISAIFQKSNLSSRLELTAFFLEDLLLSPSSNN